MDQGVMAKISARPTRVRMIQRQKVQERTARDTVLSRQTFGSKISAMQPIRARIAPGSNKRVINCTAFQNITVVNRAHPAKARMNQSQKRPHRTSCDCCWACSTFLSRPMPKPPTVASAAPRIKRKTIRKTTLSLNDRAISVYQKFFCCQGSEAKCPKTAVQFISQFKAA